MGLSASDLSQLLSFDRSQKDVMWTEGRPRFIDFGTATAQDERGHRIRRRIDEARRSNSQAEISDSDGSVNGRRVVQHRIASLFSDAWKKADSTHALREQQVHFVWQQLLDARFLTLGEYDAPFWLSQDTGWLGCLIKTTAEDVADGRPTWGVMKAKLPADQAEELAAEYSRRRSPRIHVRRVAVLPVWRIGGDEEAQISQLYFLSYGQWCFKILAGWNLGVDIPQNIGGQLKPGLVSIFRSGIFNTEQSKFADGTEGYGGL